MRTVLWHEGDVIRKLRTACGWGLDDLERESGVNFTTINKIELGKTKEPKRSTLKKIAAAFGLTATQLLEAVPAAPLSYAEPTEGRPEKAAATPREPFRAHDGARRRRSIK